MCLSLFEHFALMDANAEAKKILKTSTVNDWKGWPGRAQITWMTWTCSDYLDEDSPSPTLWHWLKQSTWLKCGHSGGCWLRLALCIHALQEINDNEWLLFVFVTVVSCDGCRVTTCLENLEMSGNSTAVREISGNLIKIREVSRKNLVREKLLKTTQM